MYNHECKRLNDALCMEESEFDKLRNSERETMEKFNDRDDLDNILMSKSRRVEFLLNYLGLEHTNVNKVRLLSVDALLGAMSEAKAEAKLEIMSDLLKKVLK